MSVGRENPRLPRPIGRVRATSKSDGIAKTSENNRLANQPTPRRVRITWYASSPRDGSTALRTATRVEILTAAHASNRAKETSIRNGMKTETNTRAARDRRLDRGPAEGVGDPRDFSDRVECDEYVLLVLCLFVLTSHIINYPPNVIDVVRTRRAI